MSVWNWDWVAPCPRVVLSHVLEIHSSKPDSSTKISPDQGLFNSRHLSMDCCAVRLEATHQFAKRALRLVLHRRHHIVEQLSVGLQMSWNCASAVHLPANPVPSANFWGQEALLFQRSPLRLRGASTMCCLSSTDTVTMRSTSFDKGGIFLHSCFHDGALDGALDLMNIAYAPKQTLFEWQSISVIDGSHVSDKMPTEEASTRSN